MNETTTTRLPPVRQKRGRPIRFTVETRRRLLAAIAKGVPLSHAPAACGVSYSGFCDYRNAHKEFERAIQRAIARAIESRLAIIQRAADTGDVNAAKWFLQHCHPEHFSRNRLELTGADGSPLAAQVALYLPVKAESEPRQALPAIVENETA